MCISFDERFRNGNGNATDDCINRRRETDQWRKKYKNGKCDMCCSLVHIQKNRSALYVHIYLLIYIYWPLRAPDILRLIQSKTTITHAQDEKKKKKKKKHHRELTRFSGCGENLF